MNREVACIVIASERRKAQVRARVLPSVLAQDFNEVVLVGDWVESEPIEGRLRYLHVVPMLGTTIDALVKRDVGTLATHADTLVYLCDDHILAPHFLTELREVLNERWDVLVPNRKTVRSLPCKCGAKASGHSCAACLVGVQHISLNNGEADGYCGGHGGVFRRHVIAERPWSAGPHDLCWDAHMSFNMRLRGAEFVWKPRAEISIIDIEPEAEPWR
jgi:hypothetical protein